MEISLKEYLISSDENKNNFLMFIESRGDVLQNLTCEQLHSMIHVDLEFFLNMLRLYCRKNQQVGKKILLSELFNKLGNKLCENNSNKLSVLCDGFTEDIIKDIEDEFDDNNSLTTIKPKYSSKDYEHVFGKGDEDYKEFISKSGAASSFSNLISKKVNDKKKNSLVKSKTTNIDAKYKIYSTFNHEKIESSSFYSLGAYTEDLMLKEYPKYYPQGSLDYNELIRSRQIEKVNLLLESDDSKDISMYMKFMGETDLHSKFKEDMQKVAIDLRDERYKDMLKELDVLVTQWDEYSEFSGVNYTEQGYDQEQIYNTIINNMSNQNEKDHTIKIINHMKDLYELKQNKIDNKVNK